jgi:hypothetical protein
MANPVNEWMRCATARILDENKGIALEVTELRIDFQVVKSADPTPNSAVIKIFNLNPTHEYQVAHEFTDIELYAGYQDGVKLLFRGNITHAYRYRNGLDRIVEIHAGDGDAAMLNSMMNWTATAGSDTKITLSQALAMMDKIAQGQFVGENKVYTHGHTECGAVKDVLTKMARDIDANWSIQDGALYMVGTSDTLKGYEAIVCNADTGLFAAQVTDKGVTVSCALNPLIRVNATIQLDNNSIKQATQTNDVTGTPSPMPTEAVRLDPDGLYKVLKITHTGTNTAQGDWKSDAECVALVGN